ncbi:MAG TPA: hypothetical protein VGX91_10710 [Candidatus Cybelea sp.]|nr:hypothetical protein [Candidatus Cybelea sp.]
MKRTPAAAALFTAMLALAAAAASAQPILYSFTGFPSAVDGCKWFDDNLNADRDEGSMTRQTDMLYNRIALPAGQDVTVGGSATSAAGGQLLDYRLGSKTVCSTAEAIYGPTPEPSMTPTPIPTPT